MEGFCCCQKTIVFWSQWILRNEKSAIGLATHPLEKRPFIIASAFLEYLVVASEKACASHSLTKLHSLLSRVGWELVLLRTSMMTTMAHEEVKCTTSHACITFFRAGTPGYTLVFVDLCDELQGFTTSQMTDPVTYWMLFLGPILGWIHLPHPTCLSLPWPSLGESF